MVIISAKYVNYNSTPLLALTQLAPEDSRFLPKTSSNADFFYRTILIAFFYISYYSSKHFKKSIGLSNDFRLWGGKYDRTEDHCKFLE
jgi:hypothetical protein